MKKLGAAIAAVAFIGAPAFAAGAAAKKPPPAEAPWAWTGAYVGLNSGYGWGPAESNIAFSQSSPFTPATFAQNDPNKLDSSFVGAQAGYNWQVGRYLFGIEADITERFHKGTTSLYTGTVEIIPFTATGAFVTDTERLEWFGTVRGRFGLTFDQWLVYGTGGLAYGKVHLQGNVLPFNTFVGFIVNTPIVWDQSSNKTGFAAGAGIAHQIGAHWSWKLEYLFVDLGTARATLSGGAGNCYGFVFAGCVQYNNSATGSITSHIINNILRVGLNYQFQ